MQQDKKAVSQIVTTILIILIVLAAIVIVWNVVKQTIKTSSEDVGAEKFSVSLSTSQVDLSQDPINISVTRSAGAGDIIAIKIIFKDDAGNSYTYENSTDIPDELETIIYSIPRDDILLTNLKSVEIYPIIAISENKNATGIKASIKETTESVDSDEDGYDSTIDCDDGNINLWQLLPGYVDTDRDTYRIGNLIDVCSGNALPVGYIDIDNGLGLDCDDTAPAAHPGLEESVATGNCADVLDNDCDGKIDLKEADCHLGLISWWRFESESGGITPDEKGVNPGTLVYGTHIIDDPNRQKVISFDAPRDYVDIGDDASLIFSNLSGRTWSFWVKYDSSINCTTGTNSCVFISQKGTDGSYYFLVWGSSIYFTKVSGTASYYLILGGIPSNVWTHLVVNYNPTTTTVQGYKNGVFYTSIASLKIPSAS